MASICKASYLKRTYNIFSRLIAMSFQVIINTVYYFQSNAGINEVCSAYL